jgi:predicted dehydrogenase
VGQIFSRVDDCTDVDAVLVATPVGTRRGILEKTTERGWHAFCEKPFATSTSEHREILKGADLNGLKLGAGHMRRFVWAVEQASKMLSRKVLGSLIEVVASDSAHLGRTGVDLTSYRNSAKASGGGVLIETGSHVLDEVMFVSGAKRARVEACAQQMWNEYEIETIASGYIDLDSGEKATLQLIVSGARPVFQVSRFVVNRVKFVYGWIRQKAWRCSSDGSNSTLWRFRTLDPMSQCVRVQVTY